ncbi:MAG: molybdopterin-binding protein [Alkaliphilus sp.]|nr:molybdopterin-binding protein [bacterium AH-315-L21]MBN4074792.1 molybdopterin-binding protein [bacterium AH-315-E09]PHS34791.1 MAG: molybdopterin-binding protein [Alkaliphilus sp.]
MKKEILKIENAIGTVLAHDVTKIVPGEFKGPAFKRGHIIKRKDLETLRNMGKNHVTILTLEEDELHEDESAIRLAKSVIGKGIKISRPSEGKVDMIAEYKGILKVNTQLLFKTNSNEKIVLATLHNNTVVEKETRVAGTRIIPLAIKEREIFEVEEHVEKDEIISIEKMYPLKTGILVTGTEVFTGRITDKFGSVLKKKIIDYGAEFVDIAYAPDDTRVIEKEILSLISKGAEVILVSGGMSVDADDVTPTAISGISSEVVSYGSPVLPGAMFMLAYIGSIAILGIPGCAMYHKSTALDLIYPRVLAKEKITRDDIIQLAHGGLCLGCDQCTYPVCPFGK